MTLKGSLGKVRVEQPQTSMHMKISKMMVKIQKENSVSKPVVTGLSVVQSTMRSNGKDV